MGNDNVVTESRQQYAAAYAAHYTGRDLPVAFQLYMKVVALHPDAQEAGYSRVQMQNIVNAVVPKQDLLDAQIELALVHLRQEGRPNARQDPVTELTSALPT